MAIYYVMILSIPILKVLFSSGNRIIGKWRQAVLFFSWFVMLTIIVGCRGSSVGTDTSGYLASYHEINALGLSGFKKYNISFLYKLLCVLLYTVSDNPHMILIVCAGITHFCVLYYIKHNSDHSTLSVYLYVALYFLFESMNMMRQFVAIGLVLAAAEQAKQRKLILFLVFILLATGFHSTALLGLVIWWLSGENKETKTIRGRMIILAIVCTVALVFSGQILKVATNYIRNLNYYLMISGAESKAGIMLPILNLIIFLAAIIAAKDEEWISNKRNLFMVYMAEISAIWSIGSSYYINFDYNLIIRIGVTFQIFSICLLPNILTSKFFKKNYIFSYCSIMIAGGLYMSYYLFQNWHRVVPYVF